MLCAVKSLAPRAATRRQAGPTGGHRSAATATAAGWRAPCRHSPLARRVTDRSAAEAKPRRGDGRRHEHAHVLAGAAGAVTAPGRRGAVGPAEARHSQGQAPSSRRALPANRAISCDARSPPGVVSCIAELDGSLVHQPSAATPAIAPEPDPQEGRRDVAAWRHAPVNAELRYRYATRIARKTAPPLGH